MTRDRRRTVAAKMGIVTATWVAAVAALAVADETGTHLKKAEAILSVDRGEPVIAGAEGHEFREAVDLMVDRLAKILRRRRSHLKEHKGPSLAKAAPLEE